MKSVSLRLGAALFLLSSGLLFADVVRLKNGDTFTGKITGRANGTVTFKGDLFGEITFSESDVADYKVGENLTVAALAANPTGPAAGGATAGAGGSSSTVSAGAGSNFQAQAAGQPAAKWVRSITFGGTYVSPPFIQGQILGTPPGTTGAGLGLTGRVLGVQAKASLMRLAANDIHSLDLNYAYTDYEPNGTQTDNYSGVFAWNHKINDRYYTVSRSSYSVDQVKNIDYSAVQMFGVGYKLIDSVQTKLDIVPGLVAQQEVKGNAYDGDLLIGAGFLENFVYYFSESAMFEQRMLYRQAFKENDLYVFDAYVGFKGQLTPQLGLSVGVTYIYDNSLGPVTFPFGGTTVTIQAQEKDQLTFTSGIEFKF